MSGGQTIAGLILLAAGGGALVYLYGKSGASVRAAANSGGGFLFDPFAAVAQSGPAFSSPVFQTLVAAQSSSADGGEHALYGGEPMGNYGLYDPSYHNEPISQVNALAPVSTASLKGDLLTSAAPSSTATLKSNLGGGFFSGVLDGLNSLFGAASALAAPVSGGAEVAVSGEVDTVARTIWGEARAESVAGMEAVANVIMNRAKKSPRYGWPKSPAAVCRQPWQFSCWNSGDPNLPKLKAVTTADAKFRQCLDIARRAVAGTLADRTGGADHYYADYIAKPAWANSGKRTVTIGRHIFMRLV